MPSEFPPESEGPVPADKAETWINESDISEFPSEDSPESNTTPLALSDLPLRPMAPPAPQDVASPPVSQRPAVVPGAAAPVFVRVRPSPTIVRPAPAGRGLWRWLMMAAAVVAVVVTGAWFVQERRLPEVTGATPPPIGAEGTATIMSRPEGADVFIDGERRGITPLRLALPVGDHALELRNGAATRSLTLTIDAATAVRETVDLQPSTALGRLEVRSDVPGASVSVDGVRRGVTPLVVSDLTPGEHQVTVSRGGVQVRRTATVQAGSTAAIAASVVRPPTPGTAAAPGTAGGWLTFRLPIEMHILEDGEMLGTTRTGRLTVPAGQHTLQLVADPYGYRTTVRAVVRSGETVAVPVVLPDGRLSIDAVPWANVWLDGRALGPTPVVSLAVPIGDHEVVLRHPELGERRQSVRVMANTPARAVVDLTP